MRYSLSLRVTSTMSNKNVGSRACFCNGRCKFWERSLKRRSEKLTFVTPGTNAIWLNNFRKLRKSRSIPGCDLAVIWVYVIGSTTWRGRSKTGAWFWYRRCSRSKEQPHQVTAIWPRKSYKGNRPAGRLANCRLFIHWCISCISFMFKLIGSNIVKFVVDRHTTMPSKHLKRSWQSLGSHLKKWVCHIISPILWTELTLECIHFYYYFGALRARIDTALWNRVVTKYRMNISIGLEMVIDDVTDWTRDSFIWYMHEIVL